MASSEHILGVSVGCYVTSTLPEHYTGLMGQGTQTEETYQMKAYPIDLPSAGKGPVVETHDCPRCGAPIVITARSLFRAWMTRLVTLLVWAGMWYFVLTSGPQWMLLYLIGSIAAYYFVGSIAENCFSVEVKGGYKHLVEMLRSDRQQWRDVAWKLGFISLVIVAWVGFLFLGNKEVGW